MDTLLRVGLSNAVAACVLAAVAAAVGYFCRRPAVRHALWLLVLLKLVTPPLIDVPVWHAAPAEAPAAVAEPPAPAAEPPDFAVMLPPAPTEDEGPAAPEEVVAAAPEDEPAAPTPQEPAAVPAFAWRPPAAAIWLGGSALWLLVAGLRARRFASLLRYAKPAPAWLQREAGDVAARLGLSAAPTVGLVPGRVSPMLWAPGWAARLLLPAELLGRLDPAGRRTLLAHELAHLRRGDHRVRLFELLVTALFWWHPVVWWARRELREAEEQCCDAWVLFALPESAKPYALALVETVDFLSEAPAALPALASGIGHVNDLRRRVTMIMQGTTPRALTWGGVLGLLGLGAFLLPVVPSWAQEAGQTIRARAIKVEEEDEAPPKAAAELQALKADLERKRAELAKAEAALRAAEARLAKAAGEVKAADGKRVIILEVVDGDKRQVIKLPGAIGVVGQPIKGLPAANPTPKAGTTEPPPGKGQHITIEIVNDGKRQMIELPAGSRVISVGEQPKGATFYWKVNPEQVKPVPGTKAPPGVIEVRPTDKGWGVVRPPAGDTEKRIADLEKRLEELMRTVKELHGELNRPKPPQAPAIPNRQRSPKPGERFDPFGGDAPPIPPAPAKPPQER